MTMKTPMDNRAKLTEDEKTVALISIASFAGLTMPSVDPLGACLYSIHDVSIAIRHIKLFLSSGLPLMSIVPTTISFMKINNEARIKSQDTGTHQLQNHGNGSAIG